MKLKQHNKKLNDLLSICIAIIFYIFIIIGICSTSTNNETNTKEVRDNTIVNTNVQEKVKQETTINNNYIKSDEYFNYLINTLKEVNNDDIFLFKSSHISDCIITFQLVSNNRMNYNDFSIQAEELTKRLYEQIKDKTIEKKGGFFSRKDFDINLCFFEKFNDNINPKRKKYIQVGTYQIHTSDLEKYRNYNECVNGGISELEWQQERK